jgi:hypothetical protein
MSRSPEPEAEEPGGEDRLVVGAQDSRPAEALDGVEQGAEECHRGAGADLEQGETGAGAVIEQAENGARSAGIGEEGQVQGPQEVARDAPGPAVLELAPEVEDLFLAAAEHAGDEGLADRLGEPAVEVVEDLCDLAAAVIREQRLEAEDLAPHPGGLGRREGGAGWRERDTGAAAPRPPVGRCCRGQSRTQTAATRRPETMASSR